MSLHARCPHCHQTQPVARGSNTQAALACRSCGVSFVPHRHLFVQTAHAMPSAAPIRSDVHKSVAAARPGDAQETPASESPAQHRFWWIASVLLALAWCLQVGLSQRDLWAAQWPAWRVPLQFSCQVLGCTVQAPRRLAALSVASSGFDQQDSGDFVLSVHLRHELGHAVATPAIELTLTDDFERAVVRKIFLPAQLGLPEDLPAGEGLSVSQPLELDPALQAHVSGFRLELFYP